jgi:4-amino-4-deoxy-L-arabinose transferase-like glycosyltransferase
MTTRASTSTDLYPESAPGHAARGPTCALIAIILGFVALSTVIAVKTPAWEANDEPGHVENIETLVSGHAYVFPSTCHPDRPKDFELLQCSGNEVEQPPLYYLVMAGWQKVVGLAPRAPLVDQVNPGIYFGRGESFLVHSQADHTFLLWLRLPNVLFGALTILAVFFAAKLVSRDPWTPVVAAAAIAAFPQFVFRSAFVTNDNLVNFLGAVLVYLALRFTLKPSWQRMAWVGACFGLMVDTKLSALVLGLLIVVLALVVTGWRRRVEYALIGVTTALVFSSWYLAWNWVHYGSPLANHAASRYLASDGALETLHGRPYVVSDPLRLIFDTVPRSLDSALYYASGWSTFLWPAWVNLIITIVVVGVLVIGLRKTHADRRQLAFLVAALALSLLAVWVVAFETTTSSRYALVGLGAFAVLVALAVERWRLPIRFILPAAGLVGTLIAINADVLAVHWT